MKELKAEFKEGCLVLTVPMTDPTPSASGKTFVIASTHGNVALPLLVQGKPVILGLNAYIKR